MHSITSLTTTTIVVMFQCGNQKMSAVLPEVGSRQTLDSVTIHQGAGAKALLDRNYHFGPLECRIWGSIAPIFDLSAHQTASHQ